MALTESQKATQAIAFAALLLKDSDKDISADNINALAKAAGVKVEKSHVELFSTFVTKDSLDTLVERLSKVGGSAPAASSASSTGAPAAKVEEAKKEESESDEPSDDDAFGGLF